MKVAVTPTDDTPTNSRKASNSRDVGYSKDPSSNRNASFKKGTPETVGSKKGGRKGRQKYGCECDSDKKNLVAVKGPQVAVVFARSGSEGLQGSGNTAQCMCSNISN